MTQVKSGCAVRAAIQEIEEKKGLGRLTSDAARAALLAAYPEHLQKLPAIELQLALDCAKYKGTIKWMLQFVGDKSRDGMIAEAQRSSEVDVLKSIAEAMFEIGLGAVHAR